MRLPCDRLLMVYMQSRTIDLYKPVKRGPRTGIPDRQHLSAFGHRLLSMRLIYLWPQIRVDGPHPLGPVATNVSRWVPLAPVVSQVYLRVSLTGLWSQKYVSMGSISPRCHICTDWSHSLAHVTTCSCQWVSLTGSLKKQFEYLISSTFQAICVMHILCKIAI